MIKIKQKMRKRMRTRKRTSGRTRKRTSGTRRRPRGTRGTRGTRKHTKSMKKEIYNSCSKLIRNLCKSAGIQNKYQRGGNNDRADIDLLFEQLGVDPIRDPYELKNIKSNKGYKIALATALSSLVFFAYQFHITANVAYYELLKTFIIETIKLLGTLTKMQLKAVANMLYIFASWTIKYGPTMGSVLLTVFGKSLLYTLYALKYSIGGIINVTTLIYNFMPQ